MSDKEMLLILERENRKLKEDNETWQHIVLQMKSTLNRLFPHYSIFCHLKFCIRFCNIVPNQTV